MTPLLALLALLLPQDRNLDALIERLDADSIEERDEAAEKLVALGEKAEKAIRRRIAEFEDELKSRCNEILRRIRQARERAKVLPPLVPITLEAENRNIRDILAGFEARTGIPIDLKNAGDASVTVKMKDVPPLQALDMICRAADLGWKVSAGQEYDRQLREWVRKPPRITIQSGGFVDRPRLYKGHYRVSVESIKLTKQNDFKSNTSEGRIEVRLHWPPNVHPDVVMGFEIQKMMDGKGKLFWKKKEKQRFGGITEIHRSRSWVQAHASAVVKFPYPKSDLKKIGSLRGRATVRFPGKKHVIRFDSPGTATGQKREIQGVTVTLKDFSSGDSGVTVKLESTGKWEKRRGRDQYPFSIV